MTIIIYINWEIINYRKHFQIKINKIKKLRENNEIPLSSEEGIGETLKSSPKWVSWLILPFFATSTLQFCFYSQWFFSDHIFSHEIFHVIYLNAKVKFFWIGSMVRRTLIIMIWFFIFHFKLKDHEILFSPSFTCNVPLSHFGFS